MLLLLIMLDLRISIIHQYELNRKALFTREINESEGDVAERNFQKINFSREETPDSAEKISVSVVYQGSHLDLKTWKTWKNWKRFSSQGKVGEF